MKITDVRATLLKTGSIFVRVLTDDGITGIGECSPMNGRVLRHFVEAALKPLLLGEDPREVDRLWHKMLHRTYKLGVQGVRQVLEGGVNDLGGTLMEETISRMAGSQHGSSKSVAELESIASALGRPVRQRSTTYARLWS